VGVEREFVFVAQRNIAGDEVLDDRLLRVRVGQGIRGHELGAGHERALGRGAGQFDEFGAWLAVALDHQGLVAGQIGEVLGRHGAGGADGPDDDGLGLRGHKLEGLGGEIGIRGHERFFGNDLQAVFSGEFLEKFEAVLAEAVVGRQQGDALVPFLLQPGVDFGHGNGGALRCFEGPVKRPGRAAGNDHVAAHGHDGRDAALLGVLLHGHARARGRGADDGQDLVFFHQLSGQTQGDVGVGFGVVDHHLQRSPEHAARLVDPFYGHLGHQPAGRADKGNLARFGEQAADDNRLLPGPDGQRAPGQGRDQNSQHQSFHARILHPEVWTSLARQRAG